MRDMDIERDGGTDEDVADAAFTAAWQGWQLKRELAEVQLTEAQLETICRLWWGRGILRMVEVMEQRRRKRL